MKTILIIEDDIVFSRSISNWLVKKGMKTECVATLANARKAIGQKEFDLILADLRLPDGNSTSLLKWMNEKYYSIPFLIMTNYGQVENAVTTMQLGAINYLCKPVQPDNLLALITEILDKNDNEQEFYRGESPKAHEMYRLIEMIACADISVLLRGASGTGKEHIAAEIHARSHRKNKPYLGMNPQTDAVVSVLDLDHGYVRAGEDGVTEQPGLFVAGDVRTKKLRQIVTAVADGANSVTSIVEYLKTL